MRSFHCDLVYTACSGVLLKLLSSLFITKSRQETDLKKVFSPGELKKSSLQSRIGQSDKILLELWLR